MTNEPLDWRHEGAEIGERGLSVERSATAAECAALALALDILACDSLLVRYKIRRRGSSAYLLEGRLEAEVTQACVVTLEPVTARIDAKLVVRFAPADSVETGGEFDPMAEDDDEPLEANGALAVGRIVFEHLAAALDPYPRKPGAEFEWRGPEGGEADRQTSPFSVLAHLKPKSR